MRAMILVSEACTELIKSFEGLRLEAYLDPVSICTIGYGTIRYPDGRKVKLGDKITKEQAEEYLMYEVTQKANEIDALLREDLNGNQFGALISFAYNLGSGALKISTLRKKVNANPSDLSIRAEFSLWVNAHDKHGNLIKLAGLIKRRAAEADLYFKK